MKDNLINEFFNKVLVNRRLSKDGIFHDDRVDRHTLNDFEQLSVYLNIKHLYDQKGCLYDNASMRNFNTI